MTASLPPEISGAGEPERMQPAWKIAELLSVSTNTVLKWHREGRIPGRRIPGQVRPVRFLWSEVNSALRGDDGQST